MTTELICDFLTGSALRVLFVGSIAAFTSFTIQAASLEDGVTVVDLNPMTFDELTNLGFSITPIAPATLNGLTASFPITGRTPTVIDHSGGLDLTKNNSPANIQDFVINLDTNILSGLFTANGVYVSGVDFFDLSWNGVTNEMTLDSRLAGILNRAYGAPNLTGAIIGTATITPAGEPAPIPEPTSTTLIAGGLFITLALIRKRAWQRCWR
jgi:hypothetical protein